MRSRLSQGLAAAFLVAIFVVSMQTTLVISQISTLSVEDEGLQATPLGSANLVTIASSTSGVNERLSISVPDGEILKSIDLKVEAAPLAADGAVSWNSGADYSAGSVYDNMNVNGTELTYLGQNHSWDFEGGAQGWTLGGSWSHGFDSSIGQTNGVKNGFSALYTYNGNYPNGLSSTSWATSPVIDCSGCAGAWEFSYWRILAVESSSFDHAYLQVKSANGAWSTLFSNGGTMRESSYSHISHDVTNHVQNNPNLQFRFGIGTTDGSVTFTGWNIDDVDLSPVGGTGEGEGNWTSAAFNPSNFGFGGSRDPGLMTFDAQVPEDSVFEWSILDAFTQTPIHGLENLSSKQLDLGIIDWQSHPQVRLKVHMGLGDAELAPIISGIYFDGRIIEDFETMPDSWTLQGPSWSADRLSGQGTAYSQVYQMSTGFSGVVSNSVNSGGVLEYSIDSGATWNALATDVKTHFDEPHFAIQFRFTGTATWDLDEFNVELLRTASATGLAFDAGADGILDWSMNRPGLGKFGLQDVLADGSKWHQKQSTVAKAAEYSLYLPTQGVDEFSFSAASLGQELESPFFTIMVAGHDIVNRDISDLSSLQTITLTASELADLNTALNSASSLSHITEVSMAPVLLKVGSSQTTSMLTLGGIFATWDPVLDFTLGPSSPLVLELNSVLAGTTPSGGQREVSLPVSMLGMGAVRVTIEDYQTISTVEAVEIEVTGADNSLTANGKWVNVTSFFDFGSLNIDNALTYASANSWQVEMQLNAVNGFAKIRCPIYALNISGDPSTSCNQSGKELIWQTDDENGGISVMATNDILKLTHSFQIPITWDDEPQLSLVTFLISTDGPTMPLTQPFGLGHANAVENDIEVIDWYLSDSTGTRTFASESYLNPDEEVTAVIEVGFEGVRESSPLSGQLLARLDINGVNQAETVTVNDGKVEFDFTTPNDGNETTIQIEVLPLKGQSVSYKVDDTQLFLHDSSGPSLLSMNVLEFDHRDVSPITSFEFVIADRPVLPMYAKANLWQSWIDDANGNSLMDADEVRLVDLILPSDRSQLSGVYELRVDTSDAQEGDYLQSWLSVGDQALNFMQDAGSFDSPLITVQLRTDGAPSIPLEQMTWDLGEQVWLHPEQDYQVSTPLWDPNSIYDIEYVDFDLAGNTNEDVNFIWSKSSDECISDNYYIVIHNCEIIGANPDDSFPTFGYLEVNFSFLWGFNPDSTLTRIPQVYLRDQQGQSAMNNLDSLAWSYSSELMIDSESMHYSIEGESLDNVANWVQPRSELSIAGDVIWYRTGEKVSTGLDYEFDIGGVEVSATVINGSFSTMVETPFAVGNYPLEAVMPFPPSGALDRSDEVLAWFIVDNKEPVAVGVNSPVTTETLAEAGWDQVKIEVTMIEVDRLDTNSLTLNWEIHPQGLGINTNPYAEGTAPLSVLGGVAHGDSIPCQSILNLDAVIDDDLRSSKLELRVWVTGTDMAGHEVSDRFNDIDAPLGVWSLETRVADYQFGTPELNPSSDLYAGEAVLMAIEIYNQGSADTPQQLIVEIVEVGGARSRIDARELSVSPGEKRVYTNKWTPVSDGTMWIEFHILNGDKAVTPTVLVEEARSEGIAGAFSDVSPMLLGLVVVLVIVLVVILIYAVKDNSSQHRVYDHQRQQRVSRNLPSLDSATRKPAPPKNIPAAPKNIPAAPKNIPAAPKNIPPPPTNIPGEEIKEDTVQSADIAQEEE